MKLRCGIYLAGPDVFLEDAIAIGATKKALCAERGFASYFPLDNEVETNINVDTAIFRAKVEMIRSADCGIFDLTPFRGLSADVGTVLELGMMSGMGKPCFGYTNVATSLLDRIRTIDFFSDAASAKRQDSERMAIGDFDNADNLMIDAVLREGGSPIVRINAAENEKHRDLRGFQACLDLVSEWWSRRCSVVRRFYAISN